MMRTLAVLPLALLLHTAPAQASGCYLGNFNSIDPAVNCAVVVHSYTQYQFPAPKLFVKRDGMQLDVTGTVDKQTINLPIEYPETDCDENVISSTTRDEPFDVYRITINGGLVGDELFVDGAPAGHIQAAAGSCSEPEAPKPICGHLPLGCDYNYDDEDDDGGGCNSGRGGAGIALGGLALVFARKRRRYMPVRMPAPTE